MGSLPPFLDMIIDSHFTSPLEPRNLSVSPYPLPDVQVKVELSCLNVRMAQVVPDVDFADTLVELPSCTRMPQRMTGGRLLGNPRSMIDCTHPAL